MVQAPGVPDMKCPECGTDAVVFTVPESVREFAPEASATAAICPACLALTPADSVDPNPEFGRILESFPAGDTGATMAIAVGLLVDSLTLNRDAVLSLFERVQADGTDPWLVLERLAVSPTVTPDTELDRLRRQLDQLS